MSKPSLGIHDYTPWYRLAEEVLGDVIPRLSDEEILQLTSKRGDWFGIPLTSEVNKEQVANRHDPHIDFKIFDEDDSIRIGIRCNTVPSVEKMTNVLSDLHDGERAALLSEMQKLDDDYQTQVLAKIKESNFAHVDSYRTELITQTNRVDQEVLARIFRTLASIREEGLDRKRDEELALNPVYPVLDLAFVFVKRSDPELFKEKLSKLRRIYEICLSVKTSSELNKVRKEREREEEEYRKQRAARIPRFACSKCGREYSRASNLRFCEDDGMRIVLVREH